LLLTVTISLHNIIAVSVVRGNWASTFKATRRGCQKGGALSMALNHLNLTVPEVSLTREFFEKYFGFRTVKEREDDSLAVMVDDTGFVLTLNNLGKVTEVEYPGAFHVGFMQDGREQVDKMYERLKLGGFDMKPPHEFHGAWTFYFRAPGGFLVEVFHQSGVPQKQSVRS
jgi:catechol 2,3-dioxygenase-like lactoylglutathione lyase family enzyme